MLLDREASLASRESASKATKGCVAAPKNFVPSAVRNSTVGRWVTKLTGKISWSPVQRGDEPADEELDRRLQHSSSPSTVTGGPAMDMKQHYRLDVSPRPKKPWS